VFFERGNFGEWTCHLAGMSNGGEKEKVRMQNPILAGGVLMLTITASENDLIFVSLRKSFSFVYKTINFLSLIF